MPSVDADDDDEVLPSHEYLSREGPLRAVPRYQNVEVKFFQLNFYFGGSARPGEEAIAGGRTKNKERGGAVGGRGHGGCKRAGAEVHMRAAEHA